jgi:hypothetical protein
MRYLLSGCVLLFMVMTSYAKPAKEINVYRAPLGGDKELIAVQAGRIERSEGNDDAIIWISHVDLDGDGFADALITDSRRQHSNAKHGWSYSWVLFDPEKNSYMSYFEKVIYVDDTEAVYSMMGGEGISIDTNYFKPIRLESEGGKYGFLNTASGSGSTSIFFMWMDKTGEKIEWKQKEIANFRSQIAHGEPDEGMLSMEDGFKLMADLEAQTIPDAMHGEEISYQQWKAEQNTVKTQTQVPTQKDAAKTNAAPKDEKMADSSVADKEQQTDLVLIVSTLPTWLYYLFGVLLITVLSLVWFKRRKR